jgi:hypothetical protein
MRSAPYDRDQGVIAPGNSIGTLTVAGNYVGNGGVLDLETVRVPNGNVS